MFVGEIGIPRREYLYDITFWEARRIIRGYQKRHRNMWSATRWQTFRIMSSFSGTDALNKAGIRNPSDLLPFPWDKEPTPPLSEDERKELLDLMRIENEKLKNTEAT